jgi:hypothetical protein
MAEQITRIDVEGLQEFRSALLGLSRASAPKVRAVLAEELKDVRDAMRANASAGLTKRSRGASDFTKGIKSYVFYRTRKDIGLDEVGGAAKAYGGFWIAHEAGATIRAAGGKWMLIPNPKYVKRYYGGKKRNRMPIGTYVAPLKPTAKGLTGRHLDNFNDEMLGVFLPLKTKRILIAVLKKVVRLEVRLALASTGKNASRNLAERLVKQITLGKPN